MQDRTLTIIGEIIMETLTNSIGAKSHIYHMNTPCVDFNILGESRDKHGKCIYNQPLLCEMNGEVDVLRMLNDNDFIVEDTITVDYFKELIHDGTIKEYYNGHE